MPFSVPPGDWTLPIAPARLPSTSSLLDWGQWEALFSRDWSGQEMRGWVPLPVLALGVPPPQQFLPWQPLLIAQDLPDSRNTIFCLFSFKPKSGIGFLHLLISRCLTPFLFSVNRPFTGVDSLSYWIFTYIILSLKVVQLKFFPFWSLNSVDISMKNNVPSLCVIVAGTK